MKQFPRLTLFVLTIWALLITGWVRFGGTGVLACDVWLPDGESTAEPLENIGGIFPFCTEWYECDPPWSDIIVWPVGVLFWFIRDTGVSWADHSEPPGFVCMEK